MGKFGKYFLGWLDFSGDFFRYFSCYISFLENVEARKFHLGFLGAYFFGQGIFFGL